LQEEDKDHSSIEDRTTSLHALSVDWHTVCKDLDDLDEQLGSFLALYEKWISEPTGAGCDQSLRRLQSQCRFYRRWAGCYRDRTSSRINLVSI